MRRNMLVKGGKRPSGARCQQDCTARTGEGDGGTTPGQTAILREPASLAPSVRMHRCSPPLPFVRLDGWRLSPYAALLWCVVTLFMFTALS